MISQRVTPCWIQLTHHNSANTFFFSISYALLTDFRPKDVEILERKKLGISLKEAIQRDFDSDPFDY